MHNKTHLGVIVIVACLGIQTRAADFQFLTVNLPDGTVDAVYVAQVQVINAAGPVKIVHNGNLPNGLNWNENTGELGNGANLAGDFTVTFTANDGTTSITLTTTIHINPADPNIDNRVIFGSTSLPDGSVGQSYDNKILIQGGVGPYILGATEVPPGLSVNGITHKMSGMPTTPGTYYVTLTATDTGANNQKVVTVLPLEIKGAGSDFQFSNILVDNGQVGQVYSDTWTTTGSNGTLTFSATGLPTGLTINSATGEVSGTPTQGGTFPVVVTAFDGENTITSNRLISIAPPTPSKFHWVLNGIPSGLVNSEYRRDPPVVIATDSPGAGQGVTYTVAGLPPGMTYNITTGEIGGTPVEVGIFPVIFTATDSATGNQIVFPFDFTVLPANGGDASDIAVNLWVSKQSIKKGKASGKDSWKADYIYNADRRTGKRFDPATQAFEASLGSAAVSVPAGAMKVSKNKYSFKSAKAAVPTVALSIDASKQSIKLASSNATFTDTLPGVLRNTVILGNSKSYRLDEFFDVKGLFTSTSGYRRTAFVVASAKLSAKATKGSGSFAMLLADPEFTYASGSSVMRFRLVHEGVALVDKTFTTLVTGAETTDKKSGLKVFKLKGGKDSGVNAIGKFSYDSKSGKMGLALKNLNIGALTASEAHVGVEMTIGDKVYNTGVTLFAPKAGSYSTKMP